MSTHQPSYRPALTPYMIVPDAQRAIDVYREAFCFELCKDPLIEGDQVLQAEMFYGQAQIMFATEGAWGDPKQSPSTAKRPTPISLYVYVDQVDTYFKRVESFPGMHVLEAPVDTFWGDRMCRIRDPFGYEWSFATPIKA